MKTIILMFLLLCVSSPVLAGADVQIMAVKGTVYVRHNVQEEWVRVAAGDVLKPEDSMKLERGASATIVVDGRKLNVPGSVVIDLSDLRSMPSSDLLLKLAMEKVRGLPRQPSTTPLAPPTTTIHGTDRAVRPTRLGDDLGTASMQLNGTRVLFQNGFYGTCVLRVKEIFRQRPDLRENRIEDRVMIAKALERLSLDTEALEEYVVLSREELPADQMQTVRAAIARLQSSSSR